ncbi:hypothetical protein OG301_15365 [Streptomyces platensis]|uniref:hypothetical protein n=1 Tax=Streptomyces platensis TaxID=58346 RepID=UPI002E815CCC|nr:hypothetical protein [Streptomyces platensis]WTI52641.1 hypothetical protein OG301_15365 [Streptomyces platensis]WUB81721.1 hypothetical protein OG424_22540 [Streptomyces platensis]
MSDYQHEVEELERESATAARLFDVRRIIGGLFTVYGVIVTIAGMMATDADLKKAQNININLWTGLGMLALGLFFLIWQKIRPAVPPTAGESADEGDGGPEKDAKG